MVIVFMEIGHWQSNRHSKKGWCGMKKIRVSVSTNRVGSTVTREFEIDDNATEEEINEEAWECACDMIDYVWEEV